MKLTTIAKIPTIWGNNVAPTFEMTQEQKDATLIEVLKREKNRYVDKIVPARQLTLTIRKPSDDAKPEFCFVFTEKSTIEGIADIETVAFLTDACHDALAEKVGVPTKYYQKCGDHKGSLEDLSSFMGSGSIHPLVWNVNYWLATMSKTRFTVRMWRNDKDVLFCRALLSDKYKFIDNFTVALHSTITATDTLKKQGLNPPECFGWNITERGLDMMLFSTEMVADLGDPDPDASIHMGKWGDTKLSAPAASAFRAWREKGTKGTMQDTGHDKGNGGSGGLRMATAKGHDRSNGGAPTGLVFAAIRIRNSETGDGSCQVRGVLMVTACSNVLMGGFNTFMIHLGAQHGEELVLRPETIQKENELVIAKLRDTASAMFTKERFEKLVDNVRVTKTMPIVEPVTAVQKICERHDVLKGLEQQILAMYSRQVDSKQDTLYDMLQAVTSVASDLREENPNRAFDIEHAVSPWIDEEPKYPHQILVAAAK